jgi:hypothetical protein
VASLSKTKNNESICEADIPHFFLIANDDADKDGKTTA